MIEPIQTRRLRLETLSIECLEALIDKDIDRAKGSVSFRMPVDTSLMGQHWMSRRLEMIRKDASHHPWMYRAIVRNEDNQMVGHISCHHGYPDPDLADFSKNGIELGYTIEPEYRRNGYARESIHAIIDWARKKEREVEIFITVSPENHPSLELSKSLGFVKVGEHLDEIDGLEYVLRYQKNGSFSDSKKGRRGQRKAEGVSACIMDFMSRFDQKLAVLVGELMKSQTSCADPLAFPGAILAGDYRGP